VAGVRLFFPPASTSFSISFHAAAVLIVVLPETVRISTAETVAAEEPKLYVGPWQDGNAAHTALLLSRT
jgi:hypothetical protein